MSEAREAAGGRRAAPVIRHGGAGHRHQVLGHFRHEVRTCLTAVVGYTEHVLETLDAAASADLKRALLAVKDTGDEILSQVGRRLGPDATAGGDDAQIRAIRDLSRGCLPLADRIDALCSQLMRLSEQDGLYVLVPLLCRMQAAAFMLLEVLEEYACVAAGPPP